MISRNNTSSKFVFLIVVYEPSFNIHDVLPKILHGLRFLKEVNIFCETRDFDKTNERSWLSYQEKEIDLSIFEMLRFAE